MSATEAVADCVDLDIDVTDVAELDERASIRAMAVLPYPTTLPAAPIVCFAFPGATYTRHYFLLDLPGTPGGQAAWHAARGWIVVAVDHLGVGDSRVSDASRLEFANVAAANHRVVEEVLRRLAAGDIARGFTPIRMPVVLGMGQSMGGCLTVIQQARHRSFDAIAVLGFSAIHTRPPPTNPERSAWYASGALRPRWYYHFHDEPEAFVRADMDWEQPPRWRSATVPGLIRRVTMPGIIARDAASITVPVLAAFGECDVLDDPRLESKAYSGAADFSLFICPSMGHMHNFANTRELLWTRIATWGQHVAQLKIAVANGAAHA